MEDRISFLTSEIGVLQLELDAAKARRRANLKFSLEDGKAVFDQEALSRHRDTQTPLWQYIRNARPLVAITGPIIYALIVPIVLLDLFVAIYQMVCFPVYGIQKARRSDFIVFDRHHLAYLNLIEKINCAYCSYATGVISYANEIASLTEKHWCPIKHARNLTKTHQRYSQFADYGDSEGYHRRVRSGRTGSQGPE